MREMLRDEGQGQDTGARVVTIARSFIGTPYRHQGALKGVGCDCLGLVRGVWRELYGAEPEMPGAYAADWAERAGAERLLEAAARHCGAALPAAALRPGDILIFRWRGGWRPNMPASRRPTRISSMPMSRWR